MRFLEILQDINQADGVQFNSCKTAQRVLENVN